MSKLNLTLRERAFIERRLYKIWERVNDHLAEYINGYNFYFNDDTLITDNIKAFADFETELECLCMDDDYYIDRDEKNRINDALISLFCYCFDPNEIIRKAFEHIDAIEI